MNRKKVLILTSRFPYPLDKGDKLRAFHQIKELSNHFSIVLCCLSDQKILDKDKQQLNPFCDEIIVFKLSKIGVIWRLFLGLFNSKPFQVNYFYSTSIQKKFDKVVERILPNHIFCQLVRASEYAKKYTVIPKSIDYMDALSKGIERRINNQFFLFKPIFVLESKRLYDYEERMFHRFENCFIISKQDAELLKATEKEKLRILPNGVDLDYFCPQNIVKEFDLVFTGNMSYPPNVDGSVYLVTKVLPFVKQKFKNIKVLIAGTSPSAKVKALHSKDVSVTGWVEDIRSCYAKSKIFVAPMQIGTGLQNKLLEAMAMNIPCVTTRLANNALGAIKNKEVLIGDSPEELANCILNLLSDEKLRIKIASNGNQLIHSKYSWKANSKVLIDAIKKDKE